MIETPIPSDVASTETGKPPLASEQGHWYAKDGSPCYQVEAKKGGMRNTRITDAVKLDLVPSVTAILNIAAKPGLEIWKADQLLDSALTLPMLPGELADDYKKRVILDAGEKSKKARDKGTELHAAIEEHIRTRAIPSPQWIEHINEILAALLQLEINIFDGKPEHSFASPLGYGGKLDFIYDHDPLIIDFKTKEKIDDKKQLVWPEHVQQLAAYGMGVFYPDRTHNIEEHTRFRAFNVFVGTEDKQIRIFEHEWSDIVDGFEQFKCLLSYWQRTKKFGPYAKKK